MTTKAPKKSVSWAAVRRCQDEPVFNVGVTSELIKEVRSPLLECWTEDDLQVCLNELAVRFAISRHEETNPDEPASEKRARKIERACRSILKELGADAEGNDIDPAFGKFGLYRVAAVRGVPSGEDSTLEKVRAVASLARDAGALAIVSSRRRSLHRVGKGPTEEKAIKKLVAGLSKLYSAAWGVPAAIRRHPSTNVADGPFVALLLGVHDGLLQRCLDTMVREPDALAQIWNRLPDEDKFSGLKAGRDSQRYPLDELQ